MMGRKQAGRPSVLSFILIACAIIAGCQPPISPAGESAVGRTAGAEGGGAGNALGNRETAAFSAEMARSAPDADKLTETLAWENVRPVDELSGDVPANQAGGEDGLAEIAEENNLSGSDRDADETAGSAGKADASGGEAASRVISSIQSGEPPQDSGSDGPSQESGNGQSGGESARPGETAEWDGDNTLTFGDMYESVGVRGVQFSEKLVALTGKEVEMTGYMAPPLTAGVRFFVLTKVLMAVCPFCSTDADWPADIVVVYLPDGEELNPTEHPVKVTGILDTGSYTDEDTGFVSLVRIHAEKVEVLK